MKKEENPNKYNKKCFTCQKTCKQNINVIVVYCPNYVSIKEKTAL